MKMNTSVNGCQDDELNVTPQPSTFKQPLFIHTGVQPLISHSADGNRNILALMKLIFLGNNIGLEIFNSG